MTTFEHRLTVDISNGPQRLLPKHNLLVFESRDALNALFITAGSESGLYARACVSVKLNSEARGQTLRAARADESRVVEAHHDYDAVAHDPLIDGAQRNLSRQIALFAVAGGPNGRCVTRAGSSHTDFMPLADAKARCGFETFGRVFRTCLRGKDEFDLI